MARNLIYLPIATLADMDVDECDSLDFEACHQSNEDSIQLFKSKPKSTKAYSDEQSAESKTVTPVQKTVFGSTNKKISSNSKAYEIRERYTLSRSTKTPYSAFYVIEALHKQMAELCPEGWTKLGEWTVPVEDDFYLHYEFSCR